MLYYAKLSLLITTSVLLKYFILKLASQQVGLSVAHSSFCWEVILQLSREKYVIYWSKYWTSESNIIFILL